jgi:hypothetical protein
MGKNNSLQRKCREQGLGLGRGQGSGVRGQNFEMDAVATIFGVFLDF